MGGRSCGASWVTVRPLKTVKAEVVPIILRVTRMAQAIGDTRAVTGWGSNRYGVSMQDAEG